MFVIVAVVVIIVSAPDLLSDENCFALFLLDFLAP